jgi:hypothetical protein
LRARISAAVALIEALLVVVPGCGGAGDGIARQAVSGSASLDGKPLDGAQITLIPIQAGPTAGGDIAQGVFAINRSEGPSAGKYRVMIVAIRPTGRQVRDADGPPGSKVAEMANVIPERYNTKTELEIEVKSQGPNTFTFELVSTSKPRR